MEILSRLKLKDDDFIDSTLRPQKWQEYVGQEKIKKNVRVIIEAAKKSSFFFFVSYLVVVKET